MLSLILFSTTLVIAVIGLPPVIIKQPVDVEIFFKVSLSENGHKPFEIECEAVGDPAPKYRWTKDGEDFDVDARGDRISQKVKSGKLNFMKPDNDDAGEYLCFAENEDGNARSNLIVVKRAFLESFENESMITELEAVEGDSFSLECALAPKGVPKPSISWMIQPAQGTIKSVDNPRATLSPETGNLWFSSVSREDASKDSYYVCSAASAVANEYKLGNRIALKVLPRTTKLQKGLTPTLQYVSPLNMFANQNKSIEIFCIYGGLPAPKVAWSKDGESIEYDERIISENYGKSLKIKKANVNDGGNYTCDVSNENGESVSASFNVQVIYPPKFTVEPESKNVTVNEALQMECEAEGHPKPTVQWFFNGNPFEADDPERELRKNTIVIKAVQTFHKGNYACYATNNASYIFKDIYVNVLES